MLLWMQDLSTSADKVRSLIRTGKYSSNQIAKLVGCTGRNVRYIRSRMDTQHEESRLIEYIKSVRISVEMLTARIAHIEAILKLERWNVPR